MYHLTGSENKGVYFDSGFRAIFVDLLVQIFSFSIGRVSACLEVFRLDVCRIGYMNAQLLVCQANEFIFFELDISILQM